MSKAKWKWFGHAGHFICSRSCRFHLCTLVGGYVVSTVGEYWPERGVREIHAQVHDPGWLENNKQRLGDDFDHAYMERFGFEDIGYKRKYETMVFEASGKFCRKKDCKCGMPVITKWGELDVEMANDAGTATANHYQLCEKWAKKKRKAA